MNDDLISRSALKKAIDDYTEKGTLHWLSDIEEIIDNAPAVETKTTHDVNSAYDRGFITAMKAYSKPQGEWILVSEGLPKEDNDYLVTYEAYGGEKIVSKSWFNTRNGFIYDNVIAWQPLPQPYKEGSAE